MNTIVNPQKEIESYEKPLRYDPNNVIFYEETSKALVIAYKTGDKHAKPLLTKAKKFLENNLIKVTTNGWACYPIKGYNKTVYSITNNGFSYFCSCQGFKKKEQEFKDGVSEIKPICSHIVAVKQFCFMSSKYCNCETSGNCEDTDKGLICTLCKKEVII